MLGENIKTGIRNKWLKLLILIPPKRWKVILSTFYWCRQNTPFLTVSVIINDILRSDGFYP